VKICPSCGRENAEDARFCAACGTALEAAATREERKVVTCLFCDLVGFTARAEAMDPEDVRRLLQPYHEHVRGDLERFGGTVEKFIGDAVVAVFGAPVAHEDGPERAVRAALSIRDALAEDGELQVRIGVTTGEALIALDANPAAGEGIASGDVVNTAARLQTAAAPGSILVAEATYRATDTVIEYAATQAVEAKGKAFRVPVWEALRARLPVGAERIGTVELVGRELELRTLQAAVGTALSQREPRLVTLVGVPGIGKSRLVRELHAIALAGDFGPVTWLRGRSLPYGEDVSFWALREMVKVAAGILDTDSTEVRDVKLARTIAELAIDDAETEWVTRHLAPLLGMVAASDGDDRRPERFAAWRRFLEELARVQPLLLVFEDLHWADDALLDFVASLGEWLRDLPVFAIGTARPDLLERRVGWSSSARVTVLSLEPLSDDATAELIEQLLQSRISRPGLARRCSSKRAATRSTPSNTSEWWPSAARTTRRFRRPCRHSSSRGSMACPKPTSESHRTRRLPAACSGPGQSQQRVETIAGPSKSTSASWSGRRSFAAPQTRRSSARPSGPSGTLSSGMRRTPQSLARVVPRNISGSRRGSSHLEDMTITPSSSPTTIRAPSTSRAVRA